MKRFSMILLGALAILMASCSKDIDPISSPDPDAWKYDETLPVPIMFTTSGNLETKSTINSVNDMVGKTFGFFAVSGEQPDWSKSNGLSMPQNASATVAQDDINGDKVKFTFDNGPYYYSQTSWAPYTFYGYHAHVHENDNYGVVVTQRSDSILVRTNVGRTDILWGRAKADPKVVDDVEYTGFNARYIRKTGVQPNMEFKHVTACVSFSAKTKKPAYAADMSEADVVKVTGVRVMHTPTIAELCIAHKTKPEKEGTFVLLAGLNLPKYDDLAVAEDVEGTDTELSVNLSEAPAALGQPLFLHPSESITVQLDYQSVPNGVAGNGTTFTSEYVLTPKVAEGSAVDGFVGGYHYKYTFVVYSPEKIVIEATVEPYKSAFGQDGEGNDIYKDVLPENE